MTELERFRLLSGYYTQSSSRVQHLTFCRSVANELQFSQVISLSRALFTPRGSTSCCTSATSRRSLSTLVSARESAGAVCFVAQVVVGWDDTDVRIAFASTYKEFKEFDKRIGVATDVFGRGISRAQDLPTRHHRPPAHAGQAGRVHPKFCRVWGPKRPGTPVRISRLSRPRRSSWHNLSQQKPATGMWPQYISGSDFAHHRNTNSGAPSPTQP
jgi:hypothetical protein